MYRYGASWVGTDISENQIEAARRLSCGMDISYYVAATEDVAFPDASFDVITACQCFWYFKHERVAPQLLRMLTPGGRLLVLYMAWLPFEDRIAGASEELVLKYNPGWSGAGEKLHPIAVPDCYDRYFERVYHEEYTLNVHFTKENWHGRVKACRGIGASLTEAEIAAWEAEHLRLLDRIAPEEFDVRHYAALVELRGRELRDL